MIKIKCDYINGAVAVPTDLLDKHLKLAPSASFKVLLFILRNPQGVTDEAQISRCTGLAGCDVRDCLDYWISDGVIEKTQEQVSSEEAEKAEANAKSVSVKSEEKQSPVSTVRKLPVKKPTQREIAKRISEEPELEIIYNEAQSILGTFGYDTQALILMIYDYYGFPPEVILTLLQHQKCEGRVSSSAIKSRAEDWAKRGIDTLELVEKELLAVEKINDFYIKLKDKAGFTGEIPTARISKFLRDWAVEWESPVELIEFALSETGCVLTDTNKLLKKWAMSGVKTVAQAEEKKKKSIPKEVKKSYDTENVGKNSVLDWIKKYAEGEEEQ